MISRRALLTAFAVSVLSRHAAAGDFAEKAEELPDETDVLVIGSGLAGLSAASAAAEKGDRVVLIEKGALLGGHSLYSSGSIAAVSPERQAEAGIVDSVAQFVQDAWDVGGRCGNRAILTRIAEGSDEALRILESEGIRFGPVFQAVAGLKPRAFAQTGVLAGRSYVTALASRAVRFGVKIFLMTKAEKLQPYRGSFSVTVSQKGSTAYIRTSKVVIASGGFTAEPYLRAKADPRLTPSIRTSANPYGLLWEGADGDGRRMAVEIGAAEATGFGVQLMPFGGGRLLDYAGGDIYVDDRGERFVNEAGSRASLASAILDLPEKAFWVITDSRSRKGATLGIKLLNGVINKSDSVRDMAAGMGVPYQTLQKTLDDYNRGATKGEDPAFGKKVFTQTIDTPPYYWGREGIYVHTTLDGIRTDDRGRVLRADGSVIPGLYAAGEVVGGVFGRDRLGGAALTNCLVMGRIAGLD